MMLKALVLAGVSNPAGAKPKGDFFHIVMLQLHVVMASLWAIAAILTAMVAIPQLRRIPSAFGLHVLQVKREVLLNALWGSYILTFSSGVFLLYKQAAFDPPFTGSDWTALKHTPYGLPYYYALYTKIGLFLLMGIATFVLAMEAVRAAKESEEAGGPIDLELEDDDQIWLEDEVIPEGMEDDIGVAGVAEGTTLTASRLQARRRLATRTPLAALWGAIAFIVVGLGGIGFCVTLIKYFHELSRSAVVYQRLRYGTG
jgi:hypothetical protein